MLLLENNTAVVYGAGGAVGGAVARAFAREGARVFLAGRSRAALEGLAGAIRAEGGAAEADEVDALDEVAVDEHAGTVAREAGGIDVSFNAIGHGDVHGAPLLDMPFEDFARPITTAVRAQFLTARAAARHMVPRRSGVIMAITATTARKVIPDVGGTGVAFDALESLCRQLARELGPHGIRVLWLQTTGLPEGLHGDVFPAYGTGREMTREDLVAWMREDTMLGRLTSLEELGQAAAYFASDRAGATTGAGVNLTCGYAPGR